jgi:hypothetical protein
MYAKDPGVWHARIQNFHLTGSNFKEIYHVCKVLQKQICDEHIFAHHTVADSLILLHRIYLKSVCPLR